jgi:hypothetical protein
MSLLPFLLMFLCGVFLIAGIAFALINWASIGLILHGSIKKNRFGINLDTVVCPNCQVELPATRKPANLRQFLWGGWTCSNCGRECDKWGQSINQ